MARQARAVVCREWNKPVSVEEVQVESPRRGEVMIQVGACGVCHSDLSGTNGTIPLPPPLVLGHEAAGTVVEVGEGVDDLAVGDRVVAVWIPMCGKCRFCVMGRPSLCDVGARATHTQPDGTTRFQDSAGQPLNQFAGIGVMAEYATMSRDNVVKIDSDIPIQSAALVGCGVMTGVGAALNTARVEPGSSVLVIGAGGIGLNVIQGCALAGAGTIIAADTADAKLDFARRFGATHTVNAASEDVLQKTRELTGGGADYAFECVGRGVTITQAYEAVRKGGTAVVVGVSPITEQVTLGAFLIPFQEKKLVGSNYGSARPRLDFPRLLALYRAKRLKLDELVTATYAIEDAGRALADLERGANARGVIVF